jgi:ribosomal protein S27AE
MPLAYARRSDARAAGARFCRRCGAEIRISTRSARGVACGRCGTTAPTDGVVRGGDIVVPRPTELRAFPIGESTVRPSSQRPSTAFRSPVPRPSSAFPARERHHLDPVARVRVPASAVGNAFRSMTDRLVAATSAVRQAHTRAEASFEAVRVLLLHWPTRLVMSIATVALAAGFAVVVVALLS